MKHQRNASNEDKSRLKVTASRLYVATVGVGLVMPFAVAGSIGWVGAGEASVREPDGAVAAHAAAGDSLVSAAEADGANDNLLVLEGTDESVVSTVLDDHCNQS